MILTLIFISVAVGSGLIAKSASEHGWDTTSLIAVTLCVLAIIAIFVSGICIVDERINHDANLSNLQAKREALVYQLENNMFLGDAVGEFNGEIASARAKHESPWTSWFYGDYYMEVEPIEMK